MVCDYTALSAYLDGELTDEERRRVEAHLLDCAACAEEFRSLERTKAMVAAYAIPSGLHGRLMDRIEQDTRRRAVSWKWAAALAAAAVLILAAALLYPRLTPPSGSDASVVVPMAWSEDSTEPAPAPRETVAQAPEATGATEPAPVLAQTKLDLALRGTVQGALPQAVIVNTGTGQSGTYGVGDEIVPGVSLAEVREKEVVLAVAGGEPQVLPMSENVAKAPSLAGAWRVMVRQPGQNDEDTAFAKVEDNAGLLVATLVPPSDAYDAPCVLRGQRSGQRVALVAERQTGQDVRIDITLDESLETGSGEALQAWPDGEIKKYAVKIARVSEEEQQAIEQSERTAAEREAELAALYKPLRQYADAHDGVFPGTLDQLVPGVLLDLKLYEAREGRKIEYLPGRLLEPWRVVGPFSEFQPEAPTGDRLVAYEQELRRVCGNATPLIGILKAHYDEPPQDYIVSTFGGVFEAKSPAPAGESAEEREARLRTASQNNLKMLAVVCVMFMTENEDYLPAGWLGVYPEYLTDPSICTAPWDELGTDSYEIVFPGASREEILAHAEAVIARGGVTFPSGAALPGDEGMMAASIPMVVEKTPVPNTSVPGRNAVFLDGHAEFLKDETWATRVAPYMR